MNLPSYISPKAKIGNNVTIEPFAVIYDDVEIGEGTWIGPNVVIMDGARIGKNCKIFPGAVISAVPQDLKFEGEKTTVEIGDNTVIREHVTIHRGTKDKMKTAVGNNCLIMTGVHIAHDCILGNHVIIASGTAFAGHCIIDDYAIIEGQAGIQQFIRIGMHAFVGGRCAVRKNIPPFVRAAKDPSVYIGVNTIGMKRKGYSEELVRQVEDIYRTIYLRGLNTTNALINIEQEIPESVERNHIIQFIKESTNGIVKSMLQQ